MTEVCEQLRQLVLEGDNRVYMIHWKTSRTHESDFFTFYVFHAGMPKSLDPLLCQLWRTRMGDRGIWIQHRIGENPVPALKAKLSQCVDLHIHLLTL
jgi:hypothetical protein